MNAYVVSVFDCAGEFDTVGALDFAQCLRTVAEMSARYPGKVVHASNLDRCDYDADGLSDDERDAIDEVR